MADCGEVKKVFVASKPMAESEKPVEAPAFGIQITDRAAEKIKLFVSGENHSPNEWGLFISVTKDGCSGNSYTMKIAPIADSKAAGDKIFEHNGGYAMIEKTSYFYVTGSILDYVEALTGSGFNLINPNIKKTCSCGSSFAV